MVAPARFGREPFRSGPGHRGRSGAPLAEPGANPAPGRRYSNGVDQNYAAASPNGPDLGEQAILKRNDKYEPFAVEVGTPFYYTSNVALVDRGRVDDVIIAPVVGMGALNSTGTTIFHLLNFDDGQGLGGGTINGDASINVNAGSLSSGGLLAARILNQNGTILGDRSVTISVANALIAGGDANFEILDFPPSGNGGTGTFSITVTAGSIDVTGALNADVNIGSDGPIYLTDNVRT